MNLAPSASTIAIWEGPPSIALFDLASRRMARTAATGAQSLARLSLPKFCNMRASDESPTASAAENCTWRARPK